MKELFDINGVFVEVELRPDETLLHVLRNNGFTEVKNDCEEGECGACLVLVDDEPVNSCMVLAMSARGRKIMTIKGLGSLHEPHLIQEAYAEAGAVQCGFCIPGFVIATYGLLKKNPDPSDEEIKKGLDGNLCRCTGYLKIIDAVRLAARKIREKV